MKKIFAFLLALTMLSSLAGCTTPSDSDNGGSNETVPGYYFTLGGVKLEPGTAYPKDQLPTPDSVYTVPSCALEGTDNVYNFTTVEVTAFQDGTGEHIYSIYIQDANTPTDEGLYIGDGLSRVTELYGAEYTESNSQIIYEKGATQLIILMQDAFVKSIEYRMITE